MHGIEYQSASDLAGLQSGLEGFFSEGTEPRVLEVFTPSEVNDKVLKDYFKYLDKA